MQLGEIAAGNRTQTIAHIRGQHLLAEIAFKTQALARIQGAYSLDADDHPCPRLR